MPLFVCSTPDCLTIENSALVKSWWGAQTGGAGTLQERRASVKCSACETGTWHGRFPQRKYAATMDGRMCPHTRRLLDR